MAKTTRVTSDAGVDYLVRLVEEGDPYGLNFCRTHTEHRPTVEFYDYDSKAPAYEFIGDREDAVAAGAPRLGQFVSRYYVFTLLESIATTNGINLCGHVPRWAIDGDAVRAAFMNLGLWTPEPLPTLHEFIVTVGGCTSDQALHVMRERLNHDEDYGFDYTLSCP
jgi:hypothetical protein